MKLALLLLFISTLCPLILALPSPPSNSRTSPSPPPPYNAAESIALFDDTHQHTYTDTNGAKHVLEKELAPDGSIVSYHNEDPVRTTLPGQSAHETHTDIHGIKHATTHWAGPDQRLDSVFHETLPNGDERSIFFAGKDVGYRTSSDQRQRTRHVVQYNPDGSVQTTEKHYLFGLDTDQEQPDVTATHTHRPWLGKAHDESVVVDHRGKYLQQEFHGEGAAEQGKAAGWAIRKEHEKT